MSRIESANIDHMLLLACDARSKAALDKVIGRCLNNPFESVNTLGRSLIKDLGEMYNEHVNTES